jgi:outer membrane lipoprotein-sorting protein
MDRRKTTLGIAGVGVLAGVVGIGLLAAPAGAGQQPNLPATTPQALVASVLTANPPAMSGTVQISSNLGLPAVPGLPELADGNSQVRVWTDGADKARLSLPDGENEDTYVDDGHTLYHYDSAAHTVTETAGPTGRPGPGSHPGPGGMPKAGSTPIDPATAAKDLVTELQNSSTISVSGTDTIAGRSAYDLLLTPKPSEKTLLREVKIAVDAQTHLPLQLTVLGDNSAAPALQVGFTSLTIGAQDPSLFTFAVPAGAKVEHNSTPDDQHAEQSLAKTQPTIVGSGWDSVVIATLPQDLLQGSSKQGANKNTDGVDPMSLLRTFGKPVSGSWGSGYVISTDVATAVVTTDGRIAAGLVPVQVLTQALGSSK